MPDPFDPVQAAWTQEYDLEKTFYANSFELAKGSIERSRNNADFVQKAAGAVVTLYTGLTGAVFSIKDNPLPDRALLPAFFLGLSIAFATAYLAFVRPAHKMQDPFFTGSLRTTQLQRFYWYVDWTNKAVESRSHFLRASVAALFIGVAFLPAPFIEKPFSSSGTSTSPAAQTREADKLPDGLVPYPQPQTSASTDGTILYIAQVREVAKARETQITKGLSTKASPPNERWAWYLAGAGVIFVILAMWGPDAIGSWYHKITYPGPGPGPLAGSSGAGLPRSGPRRSLFSFRLRIGR